MLIVVAKIIPGFWGDVSYLNTEIQHLAGSGVYIADCFTGFSLDADTVDGAHPNASGGEKMAAAFWKVLESQLEQWRQTYPRWEEGHGTSLSWNADDDGDGWINYLEFGARTNPLEAASRPRYEWAGAEWQSPSFDALRTGDRVVPQYASSPEGPFLNETPPEGYPVFVRWLVR